MVVECLGSILEKNNKSSLVTPNIGQKQLWMDKIIKCDNKMLGNPYEEFNITGFGRFEGGLFTLKNNKRNYEGKINKFDDIKGSSNGKANNIFSK